MPELPEVETVVRSLRPHVEGRRIVRVRVLSPLVANGAATRLETQLRGRRIVALRRVGKYLVFDLDRGLLHLHLRMTGQLLVGGDAGPHTRAVLELDRGVLRFDDTRQFGRMGWSAELPAAIAALGPEPFALTASEFATLLLARRGAVKPLLLNQRFVAGLGNIYVDEALFRARIHPLSEAGRLKRAQAIALHGVIVEVLQEAIEAGGSSVSDYVDAEGRQGAFQIRHRVYGREGQPCVDCGTPIERIVVGQRGTHYCPRCQRRRP